MADITEKGASSSTKVVGSDASGNESNYVDASSNGDLQSADSLRGPGVQGTLTVGTTAVELKVGGSVLSNRKTAGLDNDSNTTIYWGYTNAVTTSTGRRIFKNQNDAEWDVSDGASIWLIAGSTGNTIRISESE